MASSRMLNNIFRMRAKDRLIGEKLDSHNIPGEQKRKPLKIRQKNFSVPISQQVLSCYGAPEYALRARKIEDTISKLMEVLTIEHANMIDKFGNSPERFAQEWKNLIDSL